MDCSMPGFPVHHQLPELAQTHVHQVSDAIQSSHPLSSPSPPAFNISQHQGLSQWVSSSIRWPKYGRFSFSISPSNEYSVLISFRIHWFDLLVIQGTLKSLFRHHSSTTISALLSTPKALTKPWRILKDMGIPDHLACLLRNLYAAQEATVRI